MVSPSLVKDLVEAGVHFGHRAANWCPKMGAYIYGKKNGIHIIDVRETVKGLLLSRKFITRTVSDGKDVLFVGTKRQARSVIEENCNACGMPYVTERWLGGTLTNFRTIRARLKRLEELEQLEESGEIANYSKKMGAQLNREQRKIHRNLSGIRNMDKLPGAIVIVDVRREHNAIAEARKLGVPTVALIDSDSDPDVVDIPIPGNDDAMRAIELIIKQLTEAVTEGKGTAAQAAKAAGEEEDEGRPRRRSTRATYRADDATAQLAQETERAAEEAEEAAARRSAPAPSAEGPAVSAEQLMERMEDAGPAKTEDEGGGEGEAKAPEEEVKPKPDEPTEESEEASAGGLEPTDSAATAPRSSEPGPAERPVDTTEKSE